MQKSDVIEKINEILIDEFEVEEEKINPEAELKTDLGIDSLDFVDIAVLVEQNFGLKMKNEEMGNVKTLQDLYDYLLKKLNL